MMDLDEFKDALKGIGVNFTHEVSTCKTFYLCELVGTVVKALDKI